MNEKQVGRFFKNIPNVHGLYSYRTHGNMKFTAHKEGEMNRKSFYDCFLEEDFKIVVAKVKHETEVKTVLSRNFRHFEKVVNGDALVSRDTPNLYLAITFADCPPVFLYDPRNKILAAIHGGWRPVMNGVIYNAVNEMIRLGAKTKRLKAAILPGIRQECYQFSLNEAQKIFRLYKPFMKYFGKGRKKRCYVDIKGIIKCQLTEELGLLPENLEVSSECTCCHKEKYFSYRGEKMKPENVRAGIAMLGLK